MSNIDQKVRVASAHTGDITTLPVTPFGGSLVALPPQEVRNRRSSLAARDLGSLACLIASRGHAGATHIPLTPISEGLWRMLWSQVMHQPFLRAAGSSFSASLQFSDFGLRNGCGERRLHTCMSTCSFPNCPRKNLVLAGEQLFGASRGTFQVLATSFTERAQPSKTYSNVGGCERD